MANTNAPFGLRPVRHRNGTSWNGSVTPYFIASGVGNVFIGDPVVAAVNTQSTELLGFGPGELTAVTLATAGDGNLIRGVVTGFLPETRSSAIYGPTGAARVALVADDPNLIFQVQDDGDGTPTSGWAGANANLASGTGSTGSGLSGWELDASDTPAADASNQLIILGKSKIPDNELDDYAIWDVIINKHELATAEALGQAIA